MRQFFSITLPMLKPITYLVVTLGTIWSFQVFDLVYTLTGGGPGRATTTLVLTIYNSAFKNYQMGYASAVSMLLLAVVLVILSCRRSYFVKKIRERRCQDDTFQTDQTVENNSCHCIDRICCDFVVSIYLYDTDIFYSEKSNDRIL